MYCETGRFTFYDIAYLEIVVHHFHVYPTNERNSLNFWQPESLMRLAEADEKLHLGRRSIIGTAQEVLLKPAQSMMRGERENAPWRCAQQLFVTCKTNVMRRENANQDKLGDILKYVFAEDQDLRIQFYKKNPEKVSLLRQDAQNHQLITVVREGVEKERY